MKHYFKSNSFIIYLLILTLLGTISVVSIYTNYHGMKSIRTVGEITAPQVDACMEIMLTVTSSHLWIEEVLTGAESPEAFNDVLDDLDLALFYSGALMNGGSNSEGTFYPLTNDLARRETQSVDQLITDFKTMAITRFENMQTGALDDVALDYQTDQIYEELILKIDRVETIVQQEMLTIITESEQSILASRTLTIILTVLASLITLFMFKSVKKAQDANPLTQLPGNNSINRAITSRLLRHQDFTVIYADLDHFKAFNDKYGFSRGDQVLSMTAQIILDSVKETADSEGFVGHIGGDDFLFTIPSQYANAISQKIILSFDKGIRGMYRKEDIDQDTFISIDRNGEICKFPIISISLAGVNLKSDYFSNHHQVIDACTETKKIAKLTSASNYVVYEKKIIQES